MIRRVQRSAQWPPVFIAFICLQTLFSAVAAGAQSFGPYTDLHDFGGTITNAAGFKGPDGSSPSAIVTFDGAGNMYGTAGSGGTYHGGMVWEITAAGVYKDLHDFGGSVIYPDGSSAPDGSSPYA